MLLPQERNPGSYSCAAVDLSACSWKMMTLQLGQDPLLGLSYGSTEGQGKSRWIRMGSLETPGFFTNGVADSLGMRVWVKYVAVM